jgi:hypothetical protein
LGAVELISMVSFVNPWKIILLMQFTVVDVGAVTVGGPMLSKRTLKELVASVHMDIE